MSTLDNTQSLIQQGLYNPDDEHSSCGMGLVTHIAGIASSDLLKKGLQSLQNLTHRGAVGADATSADGCGVLIGMPDTFMRARARKQFNVELDGQYAVGNVFLPQDEQERLFCKQQLETQLKDNHVQVLGWVELPIDATCLGELAAESCPVIEQIFVINQAKNLTDDRDFVWNLYRARKHTEKILAESQDKFGETFREKFLVLSLHPSLINYKGLMTPKDLPVFYTDLSNEACETHVCIYHQRFATNTLPKWRLAHPNRLLAHNGEINTVKGNRYWIQARTASTELPNGTKLSELGDIIDHRDSDSMSLDNYLELLQVAGMPLHKAMRLVSPPAWQHNQELSDEVRLMFEYNSLRQEPWDGPMAIVGTDGRYCFLSNDRNGLRPSRYTLDEDGILSAASEIGVIDIEASDLKLTGALGPGEMLLLDTHTGQLSREDEIDAELAQEQPFLQWMNDRALRLESFSLMKGDVQSTDLPEYHRDTDLDKLQKTFQVSKEELEMVLQPLGDLGAEAVGAMGDDTRLPPLSDQDRPIYDYLRQQFAQVTNPPIDSLRESSVMSLETSLGAIPNLFDETADHADKVIMSSPLLSRSKIQELKSLDKLQSIAVDLVYDIDIKSSGQNQQLLSSLDALISKVESAVEQGATLVILREIMPEYGFASIHALLATSALHHALIKAGLRNSCSILVETASARDTHQIACLIGFGANAVYPWLSYYLLDHMMQDRQIEDYSGRTLRNYRKGINKGLLKIMSKMGISTVASYRGAQLFGVLGLSREITEKCFQGNHSAIGGLTWQNVHQNNEKRHDKVWNDLEPVSLGGIYKYINNEEYHTYSAEVVQAIQKVAESGRREDWAHYAQLVNNRSPSCLRDLLTLSNSAEPIDKHLVETTSEIFKRFDSAGMSLGALSPEAHQDLASAMNSLGCRSNSGEGGEDPARYGTEANSRIKQVASGRFGVTPQYLASADIIQIKMAQGAKPGEGGQLPGRKINKTIATLRYSVPGVTLISPPPHHDIYSIEDLAQLIYDLKEVNPTAEVSVKLVSSPGVGTIASGVVKAGADLITISGHDGGTAASPLTSLRYAGMPPELGLAEAQQTLCANGLRDRVKLQTDGGLKSGLDVVKMACLGADSFGFGTAPMVALGCKYLRLCHLNNCATGVATQHYRLRSEHYSGTVSRVRNLFTLMAEEIRSILADLGYTHMNDIIGRVDLLQQLPETQASSGVALDLSALLHSVPVAHGQRGRHFLAQQSLHKPSPLAKAMVEQSNQTDSKKQPRDFTISNIDRSIGAGLSGHMVDKVQDIDAEPVKYHFTGYAGQSFGAFNSPNVHLTLSGFANDYVGKGMAGGRIVVSAPTNTEIDSENTAIMGNTCLYGATGGELYASGRAGMRFAVRNSGAVAVIEGAAAHCCEYMTGGIVTVLGDIGDNFAAGMTGGIAYVYDPNRIILDKCNRDMVTLHRLRSESTEDHIHLVRQQIENHYKYTGSARSRFILDHFDHEIRRFWIILPEAVSMESLFISSTRDAA